MNKIIRYAIISILGLALLAGCGKDEPSPIAPPTNTVTSQIANTPSAAATDTTAPQGPAAPVQDTAAPSTTAPTVVAPTSAAAPTDTAVSAQPVEAAAIVNGQPIPLADYEAQVALAEASFSRQMSYVDKDERAAALGQVHRQVLDWMIDQMLIEQAATRLGIVVEDAVVEAEFAKAKGSDASQFAKWLKDNGLTEETFRERLRSELLGTKMRDAVTEYLPGKIEQVRLRHILVASAEEANSILRQIRTNDDFVRMAQQHSLDLGTRDSGGELGFYPRGVLSPEIDRVAFNMVVGQISDVIGTAFGYHIIQVLERDAQREVSPEMSIALQQQAFMDWLSAERARAAIEYIVE